MYVFGRNQWAWVGKSESVERQTNTLVFGLFSGRLDDNKNNI